MTTARLAHRKEDSSPSCCYVFVKLFKKEDMYKKYSTRTIGLFVKLLGTNLKSNRVKHFYPTNYYGVVKVLDSSIRDNLLVKFLEDGSIRNVSVHNLNKGKCRNLNVVKRSSVKLSTEFDNKIYSNKSGCEFTILSRLGKDCRVKFIKTGLTVDVLIANAVKGKVIDYMHPSVYGVGFLGANADLSVKYKKEYTLWHNMLKRAYCKEDEKGYYGRAFVDQSWHNFSNFLNDLPNLKGYPLWVLGQSERGAEKYNLDKDFSYFGCNTYSKDNCQFISESLNKGTTSKTLDARYRINNYRKENSIDE